MSKRTPSNGNKTSVGSIRKSTVASSRNEDLTSPQDCLKYVKEINRETARYCCLAVALGSARDCDILRDELKRSRRRVFELADQNRMHLLPHVKVATTEDDAFEKLWVIFTSCLEVVDSQLCKTLRILREFSLCSEAMVLINTGLHDCLLESKSCSLDTMHAGGSSVDKTRHELEDRQILERDIIEVRDLIYNMHQRVDVKPWTMEPQLNISKLETSASKAPEDGGMVPVVDPDRRRRRKICLIVGFVFSLVTVIIVIIVCIMIFAN